MFLNRYTMLPPKMYRFNTIAMRVPPKNPNDGL